MWGEGTGMLVCSFVCFASRKTNYMFPFVRFMNALSFGWGVVVFVFIYLFIYLFVLMIPGLSKDGWMDERCFRPLLCTVKAELGRSQ